MALDLGHGSFAGLASRIRPERLSTIFISHLHPDHFVDLVALRHWLRYHLDQPGRVRIDGPADLAARLDALHAEPGFTAAALDLVALKPGLRQAGPFTLEADRVAHTEDSYAVRVSTAVGRPGIVYSGDIGVAGDLMALVRPGDVLLIEASFGPGPVPPGAAHLDGLMVGRFAAASRPGRVLLTHLLPGVDASATIAAVRGSFDGPVEVVVPGTVIGA
jgi:ribonuclease BN (tRNA processing enzyme)